MGRVFATTVVPGRIVEAEELWYDQHRWAAWIDGFGHVSKLEGEWPKVGARLLWDSPPQGRGRVEERVTVYEARTGQTLAVEDAKMRGTQTVAFEVASGDDVRVTLTLDYELKQRNALDTAARPAVHPSRAARVAAPHARPLRPRAARGDHRPSTRLGCSAMFVFKAGVVGAGVMGGEIAQVIAAAGDPGGAQGRRREVRRRGIRKGARGHFRARSRSSSRRARSPRRTRTPRRTARCR